MLGDLFFSGNKQESLKALRECGLPTSDDYWWTRYPDRAEKEMLMMEDNTNAIAFTRDEKLIWSETVYTDFGTRFSLLIETDYGYPSQSPNVYVTDPNIEYEDGKHMYSDGHLCLFEPDVYSSRWSVLQIRNMAASWCFCYEVYSETGTWPGAEAD
jgi:hypothetical protein